MTIKSRTSPLQARSTLLTATTRSQATSGSKTPARPEDKGPSARLPGQAQDAAKRLSRFDEFEARGVGKLDEAARPGKTNAAATPFDDFGNGAQSRGGGSPLDRLKDGFSSRAPSSFSSQYGAAEANGGFSPTADPLAKLGPAPTIDPLAEIGSEEKGPSEVPGADLSGLGSQLSDGQAQLAGVVAAGAGGAKIIAAVEGAVALEAGLLAGGVVGTGAGGAITAGGAAAAVGGTVVGGMLAGAAAAGFAVGTGIVAAVPAAGTFFGELAFKVLNPEDEKTSASEFTFNRADARAAVDAQGLGEGAKGSMRRSHNLDRPADGGSAGGDSGGDSDGSASGGAAPVNGLGGDGAENVPVLTASAADVPRPNNSWDPVDGTTQHQAGVVTYLGTRKPGQGGRPG